MDNQFNSNTNTNFILTEDDATKNTLIKLGFQLVQAVGGSWLFLNDRNNIHFADVNNGESLMFTYTNRIMF